MGILLRFILLSIFLFVVGEGGLRLFSSVLKSQSPTYYFRDYLQNLTQPDELFGWRGLANANIRLENSDGFYADYILDDNGWRETKKISEPSREILVFGDSFSFGFGVEQYERYTDLLQEKLNKHFFNTAVIGWAPDQYYLLAKKLLKKNTYSAIIIQLSNNDLSDIYLHTWLNSSGSTVDAVSQLEKIHSKVGERIFTSPSELVNGIRYLLFFIERRKPGDKELDQALKRLIASLEGIFTLASKNETPVILVLASDWGETSYGREWGDRYQDAVKKFSQHHDLPLLLPHKNLSWEDYISYPDLHWKANTHKKIADVLSIVLQPILKKADSN